LNEHFSPFGADAPILGYNFRFQLSDRLFDRQINHGGSLLIVLEERLPVRMSNPETHGPRKEAHASFAIFTVFHEAFNGSVYPKKQEYAIEK